MIASIDMIASIEQGQEPRENNSAAGISLRLLQEGQNYEGQKEKTYNQGAGKLQIYIHTQIYIYINTYGTRL